MSIDRRIIKSGATFALILTLAACQSPPASIMVGGGGADETVVEQAAGKNQVGENCHYQRAAEGIGGDFSAGYYVFCGGWEQPSGHILQGTTSVSDAGIVGAATAGNWRVAIDQRLACTSVSNTNILNNAPAALLQCSRRSGGWPQLAFVAEVGGKTFYADGVPSALPAIETAIAGISGVTPPSASQTSSAAELIRATIAGKPFGSDDLAQYQRLKQLGDVANDVGDYASAERSFRSALEIQEKIKADNASLAITLTALAVQISDQGRYGEADELFARAAKLLNGQVDRLASARLELSLAIHAGNQRKFDVAQQQIDLATRHMAELMPKQDLGNKSAHAHRGAGSIDVLADSVFMSTEEKSTLPAYAAALQYKSYVAYERGDYAGAEEAAKWAENVLAQAQFNVPGFAPRTFKIAAVSARDQQHYPVAEERLQAGLKLLSADKSNEPLRAELLILLGQSAAAHGDDAAALASYDAGISLAETLADEPDFPGLPSKAIGLYLDALEKSTKADPAKTEENAEKAYAAVQLVKSDQTAQVVAQAFAALSSQDSKAGNLTRSIQDADIKLKRLHSQRDGETAKPADQIDQKVIDGIDQEITDTEKTKRDAQDAAQAASPKYQQLLTSGAPLADLQALLGAKEGLLSFFEDGKTLHGILVGRSFVRFYRVTDSASVIATKVVDLRKTIVPSESGQPDKLPVFDVVAAHSLYEQLLGPVNTELGGLDELVVAQSRQLGSLPLEVLVTQDIPPVKDGNYVNVPFLVTKLAVSYTPSPKNLFVQRRNVQPSTAPHPYIGFGAFQRASRDQLAVSFPGDRCGDDFDGLSALNLLPGTRREISFVGQRIFHSPDDDLVLGAQFTKQRLMKGDLDQYRIIHLATHGLLGNDLHCMHNEPSIIVSADPTDKTADSMFLTPKEIINLKLNADLVVLSACNTGSAGENASDSLSSLARSFFYADARGLLVTHWELNDSVAPQLTALTLKRMDTAEDASSALRNAKLLIIHQSTTGSPIAVTHPYYWAPMILVGDGFRSITPSS